VSRKLEGESAIWGLVKTLNIDVVGPATCRADVYVKKLEGRTGETVAGVGGLAVEEIGFVAHLLS